MDDFPGLLNHGSLVLTHRHRSGFKSGDVRRLADGVGEKAYWDAGLKVAHLNLRLYRGIALKAGNGYHVHIIESHFAQLGHLRLDKQYGFLRVQAAGQVIQRHLDDILADLFRIVHIVRQRLSVRNHNINLIKFPGILQFYSSL